MIRMYIVGSEGEVNALIVSASKCCSELTLAVDI